MVLAGVALGGCQGAVRYDQAGRSSSYARYTEVSAETDAWPELDDLGLGDVPVAQGPEFVEEGIASYYGRKFHGRKTANGEVFDMYGVSAAHKKLPFGTRVRVVRLDTGRELEVRINDRGPFIAGRIIDLSYGAARKLDMVRDGIAQVRLEVLQ